MNTSNEPHIRIASANRLNALIAAHGDEIRAHLKSRVIERPEDGCWLRPRGSSATWTVNLRAFAGLEAGEGGWVFTAHRASFAAFNGTIDGLLEIDHVCRTRGCINPAHLEQVTKAENQMRSVPYRVNPYGRIDHEDAHGLTVTLPPVLGPAIRRAARAAGVPDAEWVIACIELTLRTIDPKQSEEPVWSPEAAAYWGEWAVLL